MCNTLLMSYVLLFRTPLFMRLVPLFFMGFVTLFLAHLFSFSVLVLCNSRYDPS